MSVKIHPTAIVSSSAKIGSGSEIGAYSIIGDNVVLGEGNIIHPHVVLDGNTTCGSNNVFFQFCSVGAAPQDTKFRGEKSELHIGSNNVIREFVTIQPGTENGGMLTKIGDHNLFMANSHVGHDGKVGSSCWFANSVALAGHVTVGNSVIVGGLSGIHQFVHLGDFSMIAAGSMVSKDVPPYCNAQGDRAGLVGINSIGLQRKGFSELEVREIENTYRSLFYGDGIFSEKLAELKKNCSSEKISFLLDFIINSERGVCFPRKKSQD